MKNKIENKDLDIRWDRAKDYLSKLEDKYCSLVWYTRSDKNDLLSNEMYEQLSSMVRIESLYKDDVNSLLNDETNWKHGFDSGVLASIRLVLGMMNKELIELEDDDFDVDGESIDINGVKYIEYDGYEDSIDEFPFLDT